MSLPLTATAQRRRSVDHEKASTNTSEAAKSTRCGCLNLEDRLADIFKKADIPSIRRVYGIEAPDDSIASFYSHFRQKRERVFEHFYKRQKILAAIDNARRFLEVQEAFCSFAADMWGFVDGKPIVHGIRTLSDYPATSAESDAMSKDLCRRGFQFVGSTICYAHMQATGMVNDHTMDCFRRQEIIAAYAGMGT